MDEAEGVEVINLSDDPRAGLELARYHSWAVHRRQSVGEHSAQIARILATVWPDCPRKMLLYCVLHDIGEMTGDVQYPYKKKVPGLKVNMDMAESMVRFDMEQIIGLPALPLLSNYEKDVFKLCEYLEMWEYGLREMNMGNQYGRIVAQRCVLEASRLYETMEPAPSCPDIRPAVRRYMDARLKFEMMHNSNAEKGDEQ